MEDGKTRGASHQDSASSSFESLNSPRSSSREKDSALIDSQFAEDALAGLRSEQKSLPCKYLYDRRGSKLFDMICELDEYYPTRTESRITADNAVEIGECIGAEAIVVEYGSGSSTKTRVLLEHLDTPKAYLPVDISEEHLLSTSQTLRKEYPGLNVMPIVADFTSEFNLPEELQEQPACVYFPGSTIGNLEPQDAVLLLEKIAWQCGEGGSLLIGFDLQKSADVLERAYDDDAGVTAEFNLNLLHRLNRELDADFDLDQFQHVAFYCRDNARIEIYIESLCDQVVTVADEEFDFASGERIHTEYSHKYTIDGFAEMASQVGLRCNRVWTDNRNYFALMHLKVEGV